MENPGGAPILETPELEDLLQHDQPAVTIPVRIEGPVTTHRLPNRRVQFTTDVVAGWVQLAPETPKRGRAVLLAHGSDPIEVAADRVSSRMLWPAGVPLVLEHTAAVWARAADGVGPVSVSLALELWAD